MKWLLAALSLLAVSASSFAASVTDFGTLKVGESKSLNIGFFGQFDDRNFTVRFEDDASVRITVQDLTDTSTSLGGFTLGEIDTLGLEVREGSPLGPQMVNIGWQGGVDSAPTATSGQFEALADVEYSGFIVALMSNNATLATSTVTVSAVPIPAAAVLLMSAVGGLLLVRRRKPVPTAS